MKLSELINFQSNRKRLESIKENRNNIIPFVGAGISKECGLFTWQELLDRLAEDYFTTEQISSLKAIGDVFGYADEIIKAVEGNSDMIMKRIREVFDETEVEPTKTPYLIVSSFSPMVVTTNYDTLLENASVNSPMGIIKPLLPCLMGQMNEAIQLNARNLLKLHGSVEEVTSFIFSTNQYKKHYGKKGYRGNRMIPMYLKKIFGTKKVLFLGCSLDKDYTLDILEECVERDRNISHFAILPYLLDEEQQKVRQRRLTKLGIEAIYYPEGDFQAVGQLISYLADENHFTLSVKKILNDIIGEDEKNKFKLVILLSVLKEVYYDTALKFPQLLDIDNMKDDFTDDIIEIIGTERTQTDTIFDLCIEIFSTYTSLGYLHFEQEVIDFFTEKFREKALMQTEIEDLLQEKWSIEQHHMLITSKDDMTWLKKLSDEEINKYATDLILKLQYKNGMSFADIIPVYEVAKKFMGLVEDRLTFVVKTKLLNCLGAFGYQCKDFDVAERFLEKGIDEIEKNGIIDRDTMLLKAKFYANLAIVRSLSNTNIMPVLEAVEQDVNLKREYGESELLFSRSLNFYATVLKEIDPFEALDIYLEVAEIKKKLIADGKDKEQIRELTASWSTTVFNIGLLAKDIELYECAYQIICYANKYRFETIDYCNRDYCSSINVCAELELFIHEKQNLEMIIRGIKSRVDLPDGFSGTLAHTWYICAYHYFLRKEYSVAIKYVNKSIQESKKKGALIDFRQDVRTRMLLGDIKLAQGKNGISYLEEAEKIYKGVIEDILSLYGKTSFYLCAPYRRILQIGKENKTEYSKNNDLLKNKYMNYRHDAKKKLKKYIEDFDRD